MMKYNFGGGSIVQVNGGGGEGRCIITSCK